MSQTWEQLLPRITEAEGAFRDEQVEAFVQIEQPICGVEVLPFTPSMFLELDLCGNTFLGNGGEITAGDIAAFLWRISPWFDRKNTKRKEDFTAYVGQINPDEAIEGISAYLSRSYAPAPLTKSAKSGSVAAWPSFIVHTFAEKYGWTDTKTLNTPLRLLYQYLNRILESADSDFKQRCPAALSLRAAWMAEQNQQRTAGA